MHEILKRALDEALTCAYAEALFAEAEEKHVFSAAFEKNMRALIRKTDHLYQKYSRILAAAACAMIAVGCAVLLPRLLANQIDVQQPESAIASDAADMTEKAAYTAEPTAEETADTDEIVDAAADDLDEVGFDVEEPADREDETAIPSEESPDDISAAGGGEIADTIPAENTENSASGSVLNNAPLPDSIGDENPTAAAVNPNGNSEPGVAESGDDDEDNDDAYFEDDDEGDDDAAVYDVDSDDDDSAVYDDDSDDDDVAYDDDGDDDVSYDSEEDMDDDAADNATTAGVSQIPLIPAETTLGGEVRALIGCDLSESYLQSGYCRVGGERYDLPIMEGIPAETYQDAALAKLLGSAERTEQPAEIGEAFLSVKIGRAPPFLSTVSDYDYSMRKYYSDIFYFGWDYDDDFYESDVWDDDMEACVLQFGTNGIVRISSEIYKGDAYYRLSDEALTKLTERLNARFQAAKPQKVGDLGKMLGSAENYAQVYVRVDRYYDCTMGGNLSDGAFLEKLLKKYGETKLTEAKPQKDSPAISIEVTSRETLHRIFLIFYADGTVETLDGYAFAIKKSDVRGILKEYCKQKDLAEPVFYKTLGEYLSDKNFTRVNSALVNGESLKDTYLLEGENAERTLKKIRTLILNRAGESDYLPEKRTFSSRGFEPVVLSPDGWGVSLTVERDVIRIDAGTCVHAFETPEGLYEEISGLIRAEGIPFPVQVFEEDEGCLG